MKPLTLSIKQQYYDEIVSGRKKNEYREIRPTNAGRYIEYIASDGTRYSAKDYSSIPDDVSIEAVPLKYDTLKLITGAYSGKRPYIVVEVLGAEIEYGVDDNGDDVLYEYEGKEYVVARINYTLGKILERSGC